MYKKYKIKNTKLILNFILIACIILCTCFLSIGYADITSTNINITGTVLTSVYEGMFISNVEYLSSNGADIAQSQIIDYTGTMLHSNIYLSNADTTSTITYTMTIFNNSDSLKQFKDVTYMEGAYSNSNITYSIDGFLVGETIAKGASKTFNITFKYNNISTITNNQLDSYLSFNFDYYFEEETDVDITVNMGETYEFAGVSPENTIDIANISNINFVIKNGSTNIINSIQVGITYSTRSGSKQSATIILTDENGNEIQRQVAQFLGKQTNATLNIDFTNLNLQSGTKVNVHFQKTTVNNGKVYVSGVSITPIG